MTVLELVRALWPEVTVEVASDEYLTAWLAEAESCTSSSVELRDHALAHFLAHQALRRGQGSAGAVSSLKTGVLATTFAVSAVTDRRSEMRLTGPGQAYLRLTESHVLPFTVCV